MPMRSKDENAILIKEDTEEEEPALKRVKLEIDDEQRHRQSVQRREADLYGLPRPAVVYVNDLDQPRNNYFFVARGIFQSPNSLGCC